MNYALAAHPSLLAGRPIRSVMLGRLPWIAFLSEFAILNIVAACVYAFYVEGVLNAEQFPRYAAVSLIGGGLVVAGQYFSGLYTVDMMYKLRTQLVRTILSVCVAGSVMLIFGFLLQISAAYSRTWGMLWFATSMINLIAFRCFLAVQVGRLAEAGRLARNVIFVASGDGSDRLLNFLSERGRTEMRVLGIFTDKPEEQLPEIAGYPVLGQLDDLWLCVRDFPVDEVLIALPWDDADRVRSALSCISMLPVEARLMLGALAYALPRTAVCQVAGMPMLAVSGRPLFGFNAFLKRAEDIVLVTPLLLLLGPLMILTAIAIKLDSPGPVFFRQQRFGLNNRPFSILKFRSMYVDQGDASGRQRTVWGDSRITRLGRFLRRSSIDELPQLLNVLVGDMSLIGPRAHPVSMMAGDKLYHEAVRSYIARHRVRPGITGWAQINGLRGEVDTLEKAKRRVELDLNYIENWSLMLDLEILIRTPLSLMLDRNAY
jgi:Undecaprenyl-phosphate glucose phosphotransferase